MQLIKETFLNLAPPEVKTKRTPIDGYSGLYLEQNKTGYSFQHAFKSPITGKYRFMKLARFKYDDNITKKMLDSVVSSLILAQGEVLKGNDPLIEKMSETALKPPKTSSKTVNQVFDSLTETTHFKRLAENSQRLYLSVYKNHIAERFGKMAIVELGRHHVADYLDKIQADGVHNAIKKTLQNIESHALNMGAIEQSFMFRIKGRTDGERTKTLTDEEIFRLSTSVDGWDSLRNVCKMQLLTGCRNIEVSGLQWHEIDMINKIIRIPAQRIKTEKAFKKMNRPHVLPLMPKMAEILLEQRQHSTKGLVFPQQMGGGVYSSGSCARFLQMDLDIAGSTHQLRRTVATRMSEIDFVSEFDVKILLNHSAQGATNRYIQSQFIDRKLELLTRWHECIAEIEAKTMGAQINEH